MAHPCQALSSGTVQWQQNHLRALSSGHSPSWHCHQPHRLQAGGGQQAWAQHPLSWPWGLQPPCPVLKDTATGDTAPPSHCSVPPWAAPSLLLSFSSPRPAPGPRHVDFAFWRQFLELSPLVLPSHKLSAHVAPWHHGTGSLPGNRNPGLQRGVQPSPSHFYSSDAGWTCLSLSPQDPSCPQGQLPPLPRPGRAFLWPCCVFL